SGEQSTILSMAEWPIITGDSLAERISPLQVVWDENTDRIILRTRVAEPNGAVFSYEQASSTRFDGSAPIHIAVRVSPSSAGLFVNTNEEVHFAYPTTSTLTLEEPALMLGSRIEDFDNFGLESNFEGKIRLVSMTHSALSVG